MASTDYDFTLTRNEIIASAFEVIGALYVGESLTAELQQQGVNTLNAMVKAWQAEHVFLWTKVVESVTLVASTASYALSDDPPAIAIDRAYLVDGNDEEQIEVISYRDYYDITDKTEAGTVAKVFFDGKEAPTVFVHPVPDASGTLKLWITAKLKDFDSASGTTDFSPRWLDALVYGLASRLAPKHRLPLAERNALEVQAARYFYKAKASDRDRTDRDRFMRGAF